MSEYIVCVSGERDTSQFRKLIGLNICRLYMDKPNVKFIFGNCSGVDANAKSICQKLEIPYEEFPAEWNKHGLKAGPIRNAEMIKLADHLIAFHSDLSKSKGTKQTINLAKKKGIIVEYFKSS